MNLLNVKYYQPFEQGFLETLNECALLRKRFLRANHVPYMTKSLGKAITRRTELVSKYLKNRTIENKTKYKKQKNYCKRSYKTENFLV